MDKREKLIYNYIILAINIFAIISFFIGYYLYYELTVNQFSEKPYTLMIVIIFSIFLSIPFSTMIIKAFFGRDRNTEYIFNIVLILIFLNITNLLWLSLISGSLRMN